MFNTNEPVILSEEEYNNTVETLYLSSMPATKKKNHRRFKYIS